MANKRLQRSLKRYLSKMKNSRPLQPQVQLSLNNSMMMSKSFILSGCKHPKTQSFALNETQGSGGGSARSNNAARRDDEAAAQLEDIDKFLFENFRSLYLRDVDVDVDVDNNNNNRRHHSVSSSNNNHSVDDDDRDRNEARKKVDGVAESGRFYLRRGSSSSSLVDEGFRSSLTVSEEITAPTTTTPNNDDNESSSEDRKVLEGSIAVLTYSSSPYDDFKKSMQEMVDARKRSHDGRVDWEFMEEILFCFINLNDKKSYKYLLNAFVDLIITLRSETTPSSGLQESVLPTATAAAAATGTTVMSVRRKKRPAGSSPFLKDT